MKKLVMFEIDVADDISDVHIDEWVRFELNDRALIRRDNPLADHSIGPVTDTLQITDMPPP